MAAVIWMVVAGIIASSCSDAATTTPPGTTVGEAPRPAIGSNRVVIWGLGVKDVAGMTDENLDEWQRRGVGGFVVGIRSLAGMGGSDEFSVDTNADLSGRQHEMQRTLRDTRFASRVAQRGMSVYFSFYLVNLFNHSTPLADWFDDAGWADLVLPRVREVAATMKTLGFHGLAFDQELYPQQGGAATASWSWAYPGNTRPEAETRAKVRERGRQLMSEIVAAFPGVRIIAYGTQLPEGWDAYVQQQANGISGAFVPSVHLPFWDGMSLVPGHEFIKFIDAIFYKSTQVPGTSWDVANRYNANRIYALLSRSWTDWAGASQRVHVAPFTWIDAGNTSFEAARPAEDVQEQLAAARRWSPPGEIFVYAYNFAAFDYTPYVPALRSASASGTVDTRPPTVTISTTRRVAGHLQITGSATDDLAVKVVHWTGGGRSGSAVMTWDDVPGDDDDGTDVRMSWRIDSVPAEVTPSEITITVEDMWGLTTDRRL